MEQLRCGSVNRWKGENMSDGYDSAQRDYDNITPPDEPDNERYWWPVKIGQTWMVKTPYSNTSIRCENEAAAKRIADLLEQEDAS